MRGADSTRDRASPARGAGEADRGKRLDCQNAGHVRQRVPDGIGHGADIWGAAADGVGLPVHSACHREGVTVIMLGTGKIGRCKAGDRQVSC